MQKIQNNLYIDVGHNESAAKVILNHFKNSKINLIYNTYKDKNYHQILKTLKPIINKLYILDFDNDRIVDINELQSTCISLGINYATFDKISQHNIIHLVFGSFTVVEYFLAHKD